MCQTVSQSIRERVEAVTRRRTVSNDAFGGFNGPLSKRVLWLAVFSGICAGRRFPDVSCFPIAS